MSAHCPKDGGFIGAAGCTHPRHAHSALVRKILAAKSPANITEGEARRALAEGFYVDDPQGNRIGFGKPLLAHLTDAAHHPNDARKRLARLEFAVATVRRPDAAERDHRLVRGRTAYARAFREFGMLVVADTESGILKQAFTFVPKRKNRKGEA